MKYIGIDPGLTGAIAWEDERGGAWVSDLPTVIEGRGTGVVKTRLAPRALADLVRYLGLSRAVLERTAARPGQGVSSMFSMGVTRGVILGVFGTFGIQLDEVEPALWKAHFQLLGAEKEASLELARRLFPSAREALARKKDHNRAEALLLARYLKERTQR